MRISLRNYSHRISLAVGLVAVLGSGCTVQKQTAPGFTGPSELGLAVSIAALPEVLPRDGSSMSAIAITAFDSNGKPKAGQRLILSTNAGTLSPAEVLTNADGKASATFIAPGLNERVSTATIVAIPVGVAGGDAANINDRSVRISVLGPSIPFASFTFAPASPAVLDSVTFDANASSLDGRACGSGCTYSWNFDDGSNGDEIAQQHTFTSPGVFNVTLTVTSIAFGTSNSQTRPLVIAPPSPPVANFTTGPCAVVVPRCVRFTDASTVGAGATINGAVIDFGDNANATGLPVEHTYAVAGSYNVRLTVTDSLGRSANVLRPVVIP
jgi:PKD repeat protein